MLVELIGRKCRPLDKASPRRDLMAQQPLPQLVKHALRNKHVSKHFKMLEIKRNPSENENG